ncbi:hypothetical protein RRF57_000670 [Xylaria bambusicola]|uniref:Uncharacterized protein n=1 Tax=Xylaria bambusicola TaxID=326684 RepID=A0AAN7UA87_9PEZI
MYSTVQLDEEQLGRNEQSGIDKERMVEANISKIVIQAYLEKPYLDLFTPTLCAANETCAS